MKTFFRFVIGAVIFAALLYQIDYALQVEAYKTCLQIPQEIRKGDCEKP